MSLSIYSRSWKNNEQTLLFDFALSPSSYAVSKLNIQSNTSIYQNKKKELFISNKNEANNSIFTRDFFQSDYVFSVNKRGKVFYISQEKQRNYIKLKTNKLWMILKFTYLPKSRLYLDNYGYVLQEGQIIRLGNVMFKIVQIRTSYTINAFPSKNNDLNTSVLNYIEKMNISNSEISKNYSDQGIGKLPHLLSKELDTIDINYNAVNHSNTNYLHVNKNLDYQQTFHEVCRVCFGDSNEDKLISICKCAGSVKYIHLNCLYKWISKNVIVKSFHHLSIYSYTKLDCELCKTEIPEKIRIDNELVNIYDPYTILLAQDENNILKYKNFIVLQYLKDDTITETKEEKFFILNFLNKTTLTLGRNIKCDIKMTDNSISNYHASIKYKDGFVYLNDLNSRYGTHISLKKALQFPIMTNGYVGLQWRNSFLCIQSNLDIVNSICKCFSFFHKSEFHDLFELYYKEFKNYLNKKKKRILENLPNSALGGKKFSISKEETHAKISNEFKKVNEKEITDIQRSDGNLIPENRFDNQNNNFNTINIYHSNHHN